MLGSALVKVFGSRDARRSRRSLHSPLMDLAARLQAVFPCADIRVGTKGLTVCQPGPSGFPVSVELADDLIIVCFGPGIVEFDDIREALNYVILACSGDARLRILRNGTTARRWWL